MQTLISVFQDRSAARRAMERLVRSGFAPEDVHVQAVDSAIAPGTEQPADTRTASDASEASEASEATNASDASDAALGDRTMATAEREVAVDRRVVEMLSNFFVGLFGGDRGRVHARRYSKAVGAGRAMLLVDARDDQEAEHAAVILHEMGATEVDDHHEVGDLDEVRTPRAGVHVYDRNHQPTLRDLVGQRHLREESITATTSAPELPRQSDARESMPKEPVVASAPAEADKQRPD